MATGKQEVLDTLSSLPDDAPLDEIVRRLQLRSRLLHSREQALRGELIPNDQVMKDLDILLDLLLQHGCITLPRFKNHIPGLDIGLYVFKSK